MTIRQIESTLVQGAPRLLFLFTVGDKRWAYASGVESEVTHLSDVYQPEAITLGGYTQSLAENAPTASISVVATASVCSNFIAYQPASPMFVKVYRWHTTDADGEFRIDFIGEVVSSARDEELNMVELGCRLVSSKFDRNVPWPVYQKPCNRALYSVGCGVNREAFKVEAVLSAASRDDLRSNAFASKPNGWFNAGYAVNASGESRLIVYHNGDTITLQTPFVSVAAGEEVVAYAGCDLTRQTCRLKFNNLRRHLGFSWVPADNPFTDAVFGANPNSDV